MAYAWKNGLWRCRIRGLGRFHARSISDAPDGQLVAIAAPSHANARAAAADFPQARIYRNWEALIGDAAIEAVAVATPNHLHAPIAVAALEAGKHVLLEKPMASTLADCDRIIAAAKRSTAQLSIGLQCRLSPQWGRIRSLIEAGGIGRVEHVHVSLFRHPYRQGSTGWRYDKARVGSWILEEPVHFFDLALWYLAGAGRPVEVRALGAGTPGMQPIISVLMQFPDGATASVNQILAGFEHHQIVEVVGDKGAVRATWSAAPHAASKPPPRCGCGAPATMRLWTFRSRAPVKSTSWPSRRRPRSSVSDRANRWSRAPRDVQRSPSVSPQKLRPRQAAGRLRWTRRGQLVVFSPRRKPQQRDSSGGRARVCPLRRRNENMISRRTLLKSGASAVATSLAAPAIAQASRKISFLTWNIIDQKP
jgi:myo-inositol 2-dehydrogenase/D-chiro-inositol 1-dehydrogenase